MLLKNTSLGQNQVLLTTTVAVCATAAVAVTNYALGKEFGAVDALAFGVTFWAFYFLIQRWLLGRRKKKSF